MGFGKAARPDPTDVMLAGQDFPLLRLISKGMDSQTELETHGRLAGFYQIYYMIEGEFGSLPFGTLDLTGPSSSEQAVVDSQLDSDKGNDLVLETLEMFPNLKGTLALCEDPEEGPFHVGVLVAYCATAVWLKELADMTQTYEDADEDVIDEVDESDELDSLFGAEPDDAGEQPIAAASRSAMGNLTDIADSLIDVLDRLEGVGLRSVNISLVHAGLVLQGRAQGGELGTTGTSRILDVNLLAKRSEDFERITGVVPTVSVQADMSLIFQALLQPLERSRAVQELSY